MGYCCSHMIGAVTLHDYRNCNHDYRPWHCTHQFSPCLFLISKFISPSLFSFTCSCPSIDGARGTIPAVKLRSPSLALFILDFKFVDHHSNNTRLIRWNRKMGQMRRPTQNSSFAANNELAEIHANDPSEYEDLNTESFLADRLQLPMYPTTFPAASYVTHSGCAGAAYAPGTGKNTTTTNVSTTTPITNQGVTGSSFDFGDHFSLQAGAKETRAYFLCGIGLGKPLQKDYMSSLTNLIFCISKKKTRSEALNCARTYLYLAPFASVHMYEAQKLMGLGRSAR
ncbi:hypothetical protein DCAR_0100638 [Daucus carota subsp. sativus]|uniref:Uncharacterized protein n=1 Tax=Daucus carota subsp. sativus TaxID=79200 RepID=A0A161ZUR5_DAUCS|nr:hypothetical protein DCAR_0100638 [Daucus carota subsp. sativus]